MTDPLTDAVRRLKELQQDVERLQSAEDEEGEPRLFFTSQEQAQATEDTRIGPDIPAFEQANVTDRQAKLVANDILNTDTVAVRDQQAKLVANDIQNADIVTAGDIQQDLRLQRVQNDDGFYNTIGYNTSSYDNGDVVRTSRLELQFAETATATDTTALIAQQITQPQSDTGTATDNGEVSTVVSAQDTASVADSGTISGRTVGTGTYNTTGYTTTAYQ